MARGRFNSGVVQPATLLGINPTRGGLEVEMQVFSSSQQGPSGVGKNDRRGGDIKFFHCHPNPYLFIHFSFYSYYIS